MKLFSISKASRKTNNIIYNSPHSGEKFPPDFLGSISIDEHTLLCSGDSFVDRLFIEAPNNGSVLMSNDYARSFVDTNREAYELDPTMFSGEITESVNSQSSKVKMGFGSIAKFAYTRRNIYHGKIPFDQAQQRLDDYYFPVHKKLNELLDAEFSAHGYSMLVDCHSMPSYEFIGQPAANIHQPDIILGDLYGKSCHPAITAYLTRHFQKYDLSVSHNTPFAGGYNTVRYSAPAENRHAIQIEIKKSLYMNEYIRQPNEYFEPLKIIMSSLCYHLAEDIDGLIEK